MSRDFCTIEAASAFSTSLMAKDYAILVVQCTEQSMDDHNVYALGPHVSLVVKSSHC